MLIFSQKSCISICSYILSQTFYSYAFNFFAKIRTFVPIKKEGTENVSGEKTDGLFR